MSLLGEYRLSIDQHNSYKLYSFIKSNRLPVKGITEKGEKVFFTVPAEIKGTVSDYFDAFGIEYQVISVSGLLKYLKVFKHKIGLLLGSFISLTAVWFLGGYILSFEILCESSEIKEKIMAILSEENITAGCKADEIDFTVAEREIKKKIDEVSWAGITIEGSKVIIDVEETTPKPEFIQKRLPSDLIACENGVIDKIEVMDGQLLKTVGSAVTKGDKIVSGKVVSDRLYYKNGEERHDLSTRYTRSIGCIYGTFERSITFEQPLYTNKKVVSGNSRTRYSVNIFDSIIPLFFDRSPQTAELQSITKPLSVFGLELPISFSSYELTDYSYITVSISRDEAEALLTEQFILYESNFLSGYDIISSERSVEFEDDVVLMTINYTLYGKISEEVDFFIKK
ncbi:MAG: sporulation protein YqfD [Ruminococcus sp.]|nr:sporulation protein YqfD [Ruminococcus sp.]